MSSQMYTKDGLQAVFPRPVQAERAPTTSDLVSDSGQPYQLGQAWVYKATKSQWSYQGAGVWAPSAGASSVISTLTGDSGGALSPTLGNINILGGTGASVVGSGSTLTINVTGIGAEFTTVTSNTQMAINQGYITNKAGTAATMTLPATASLGSSIRVLGRGATGWIIAQNASQVIRQNGSASTTGATGTATNTSQYQSLLLTCIVADTDWSVEYSSDVLTLA